MYHRDLILESEAASVRISRHAIRGTLGGRRGGRTDVAEILGDELVSNAIKHGAPPIRLTVAGDRRHLVVSVFDAGPGRPEVREAGATAESGRGMRIVDTLADRWGVRAESGGKTVWFELTLGDGHDPGP
jgi:anti-sigma regulatory factor (Ser/Thr protein kinase)